MTVEEIKYHFPLVYRRINLNSPFTEIKDIKIGVSLTKSYVRFWLYPGTKKAEFIDKINIYEVSDKSFNFILSKLK